MKQLSITSVTRLKAVLFMVCLIPLGQLAWGAATGTLGADPVQKITHVTGLWALRLLLLTLAVTPVKRWTGWLWLARLRRMVALYAFCYAGLHVLVYLVFDQFFDWPEIAKDIAKRPHLTAGFVSVMLMIPLAITSTNSMMRRLGRRWQTLHRLAYPVAAGGVLHYFWLVKRDVSDPTVYALILSFLLCTRLLQSPRKASVPRPLSAHGASTSS